MPLPWQLTHGGMDGGCIVVETGNRGRRAAGTAMGLNVAHLLFF